MLGSLGFKSMKTVFEFSGVFQCKSYTTAYCEISVIEIFNEFLVR